MYKIVSVRYESVIQKKFALFAPPITNPFLRPCIRKHFHQEKKDAKSSWLVDCVLRPIDSDVI